MILWEPGRGKQLGGRPALAHLAGGIFYPLVTRLKGGQGQRAQAVRGPAAAEVPDSMRNPTRQQGAAGVREDLQRRPRGAQQTPALQSFGWLGL